MVSIQVMPGEQEAPRQGSAQQSMLTLLVTLTGHTSVNL
jgi:hypothetical protein